MTKFSITQIALLFIVISLNIVSNLINITNVARADSITSDSQHISKREHVNTKQIYTYTIDGEFNGWSGDTIFIMTNGAIWRQTNYAYNYMYAYNPKVIVYWNGYTWILQVEGQTSIVEVEYIPEYLRSKINGDFSGWSGNTLFILINGWIFKQYSYNYYYTYSYYQDVIFIPKIGYAIWRLYLPNKDKSVDVELLYSPPIISTVTPLPTNTLTASYTITTSPTPQKILSPTLLPTNTPTATSTPTPTASSTATPTASRTGTPSQTPTSTSTPTQSVTPTTTLTPTQTTTPPSDFSYMSLGSDHSCAITSAGAVWCWGFNQTGQIGDSTLIDRMVPTRVNTNVLFSSITLGAGHTCGIEKGTGKAWCWGYNHLGQLGVAGSTGATVPTVVSGGRSFTQLVAGNSHTCGLEAGSGQAWCWGYNQTGQLGIGTTTNAGAPTAVAGGHTFSSLAAGSFHTCGVETASANVWCWGQNSAGQVGDGTTVDRLNPTLVSSSRKFASLGLGRTHSCATEQGSSLAFCWGLNATGQLGNGTSGNVPQVTPAEVVGGRAYTSLAGGDSHTCGLEKSTGTMLCWGANSSGQLGVGTTSASLTPGVVQSQSSISQIAVGADGFHTCAVASGVAVCWGNNGHGQLGDGTLINHNSPALVSGQVWPTSTATPTASSTATSTASRTGTPSQTPTSTPTPTASSTATPTTSFTATVSQTASATPTVTRTTTATLSASSTSTPFAGATATPTALATIKPQPTYPSGRSVSSISAGQAHTCVIALSGAAWCWGSNYHGTLGDGTTIDRTKPVKVIGDKVFSSVTSGGLHTCGLEKNTLKAWCWGNNR